MRQIKYLLILVALALIFQACEEEKIATFSESFVYFDTKSGNVKTLTVTEGQSIVVDLISSSPSFGADNTITFTVTPPVTEFPESAEYEIWDMNGNVMSEPYSVTVDRGVGTASFQFHPVDNDLSDGTRTFTLTIQSNTSGFTNGVSEISKEAISINIQVRDDDHPLNFLFGSYNEQYDGFEIEVYGDDDDYTVVYFEDLMGVSAMYGIYSYSYDVFGTVDDVDNPTTITLQMPQNVFIDGVFVGQDGVAYMTDYKGVYDELILDIDVINGKTVLTIDPNLAWPGVYVPGIGWMVAYDEMEFVQN